MGSQELLFIVTGLELTLDLKCSKKAALEFGWNSLPIILAGVIFYRSLLCECTIDWGGTIDLFGSFYNEK